MITQKIRRKSASITHSRWSAYATAATATALGCASTAQEAASAIHYSGPINHFFSGDAAFFQLDMPGNSIGGSHYRNASFSAGFFHVTANLGILLAGFYGNTGYRYASKLGSGIDITGLADFIPIFGTLAKGNGHTYSQWTAPGAGFIGFIFDGGSGTQYGWARLTVDGTPGNTFTLVDFAYGDVGDQLATGQVPEPGSLALLAIGATGLVAWRKRRAQAGR